jgi:hypothetical protein
LCGIEDDGIEISLELVDIDDLLSDIDTAEEGDCWISEVL